MINREEGHTPSFEVIGEFEIQRVIGRGGMGMVFLARQTSLNRLVALKVLPSGLSLDPITRQRFQLEARVAAGLAHPNIVPVYAVGAEQGVDYYAMQYIEGLSVAQLLYGVSNTPYPSLAATMTLQNAPTLKKSDSLHAEPKSNAGEPGEDATNLIGEEVQSPVREIDHGSLVGGSRMEPDQVAKIGFAIADALAAAHRKGIIHRDVKPSNILLDVEGKPYLSDFGLAHAEQDLQLTSPGTVLGSLKYMSPEQLDPDGESIDARCDVYGLGASLYEMLTRKPVVQGKNRNEVLRNLLDRVPKSPRSVNPAVPRDLNTIIVTALQPDRNERYSSASALASDLKAFLEQRPIAARQHSIFIRFARWVGRNPTIAGLGFGLLSVLAVAAIGASIVAFQMSQLARDRSDSLAWVQSEKARAEALSKLLIDAFRSPDPATDGRKLTVASMLSRAMKTVLEDTSIDNVARGDLLDAIGQSLRGLGDFKGAAAAHQECFQLRDRILGHSALPTLQSKTRLALAYRDQSDLKTSIPLYEEAVAMLRKEAGVNHLDTMEAIGAMAMAYQDDAQLDRALPLHEESLRLRKANLGEDHPATFQAMNNMALWYQESNRLQEGYELHRNTCRMRTKSLGERHPDTLQSMANLVGAMQDIGLLEEALPLQEKTLALHREVLGELHPNTLINLNNTALFYGDLGRTQDATVLFEEVVAKMRSKLGNGHQDTLMAIGNLAYYYHEAGRCDDAIQLGTERLQAERIAHGDRHITVAVCRSLLGTCYLGRYRTAVSQSSGEKSPSDAVDLKASNEDLKLAEEHLRAAYSIRQEQQPNTWTVYREMSKLGEILSITEQKSEAEPLIVEGYLRLKEVQEQIPASTRDMILADAKRRVIEHFDSLNLPEQAALYVDR